MSINLIRQVWDVQRLKGSDKFVLVAMADFANHDGTNIFPSNAKLMTRTGLSERQVRRSLRVLEQDGVLVPTPGDDTNLRRYRIETELIPDHAHRGQRVRADDMAGKGGQSVLPPRPRCREGEAKMASPYKRPVKITTKISTMDPSPLPARPVTEVISMDQVSIAIEAYNEAAEQCPERTGMVLCKQRTAARDKAIRTRLGEVGLMGWRRAMAMALESDFISGRSERGRGHENFRVDITWISKPDNFAKVIEGKYGTNIPRRGSLREAQQELVEWAWERENRTSAVEGL